jgi:DNA-binding protein Fis
VATVGPRGDFRGSEDGRGGEPGGRKGRDGEGVSSPLVPPGGSAVIIGSVALIGDRRTSNGSGETPQASAVVLVEKAGAESPGYVAVDLDGQQSLKQKIEAVEAQLVLAALERQSWNQTKAAIELGLSRPGLLNKIRRYRLRDHGKTRPTRAAQGR